MSFKSLSMTPTTTTTDACVLMSKLLKISFSSLRCRLLCVNVPNKDMGGWGAGVANFENFRYFVLKPNDYPWIQLQNPTSPSVLYFERRDLIFTAQALRTLLMCPFLHKERMISFGSEFLAEFEEPEDVLLLPLLYCFPLVVSQVIFLFLYLSSFPSSFFSNAQTFFAGFTLRFFCLKSWE